MIGVGLVGGQAALYEIIGDALHRLLAVVEEPNRPSARLLERAGFRYEGTARECEWKGDGFISLRHYALLRSDLPDL